MVIMAEEAKWYVVHTYSGYENKVATNIEKAVENRKLHELINEVLVPTETVKEIKDNKAREVERKIFPGYVLVKMIMTDDSWYVVRNIRGVTGFVGPGSKPVPLTDKEVEALGVGREQVEVNYAVGDSVRIIEGYLDGFIGVVDEIDKERSTVKVTVSMFGRETPVELELGQVSPLE
jgi:transcriptional antiterminator NusG